MSQNYDDFHIQHAMRLAQTKTGQKLLSLLRQSDPQQLQKAAAQASSGDYEQMKQTMSSLIRSPEAQALLRQLEKQYHE